MPDIAQGMATPQNYINVDRLLTPKEIKQTRRTVNNATPLSMLEQLTKFLGAIRTVRNDDKKEVFMLNVLAVIEVFVSKEIDVSTEEGTGVWLKPQYTKYKIAITQIWLEVVKWNAKTQKVHIRILRLLPEKVMKCLTNPLHTSDYLVSAFDLGGPLSLYSLKGIFVLMTTYNMEVVDFYTRLYSLFHEQIFEPKFQVDFFMNLDIFLTSTHLPEKLVAAFVKKLARMSLTAPAPSIVLICAFIQNLMIRHPGLVSMVNTKDSKKVTQDPFIPNEKEPMNSRAIESSLWEIKTLQNHILPTIATAARFIDKPVAKKEVVWLDHVNLTYEQMLEDQMPNLTNPEFVSRIVPLSTTSTCSIFYAGSGVKKAPITSKTS